MERLTYRRLDQNGNKTDSVVYESRAFKEFISTMPEREQERILLQRLAYYEDLEEQGRLIILPCKMGVMVYRICPWSNESYDAHHCTIVPWKATYNRMPIIAEKLGTKIFLSREEAEKTLEKIK